jgi:hypothetical protein
MDRDEPITDKDNFPPKSAVRVVADVSDLAFSEGMRLGYREALMDIAVLLTMMLILYKTVSFFDR